MAHFPMEIILQHRASFYEEILAKWEAKPGFDEYLLQCPCMVTCGCADEMDPLEYPRLMM